jgi:hypothetical protein
MGIDVWRTRPFLPPALGRVVDRMFDEAFVPFYGGRDGGERGSGQRAINRCPLRSGRPTLRSRPHCWRLAWTSRAST